MRFRSSDESSFNQSRTGSLPTSLRKKIAGIRLPCFCGASTAGTLFTGDWDFTPPHNCTINGTQRQANVQETVPQLQTKAMAFKAMRGWMFSTPHSKVTTPAGLRRRSGQAWRPSPQESLHKALVQHGVGYLQEAADVGAVYKVAGRPVFFGRFVAVLVDGDHDLVQTVVHFVAGPA